MVWFHQDFEACEGAQVQLFDLPYEGPGLQEDGSHVDWYWIGYIMGIYGPYDIWVIANSGTLMKLLYVPLVARLLLVRKQTMMPHIYLCNSFRCLRSRCFVWRKKSRNRSLALGTGTSSPALMA